VHFKSQGLSGGHVCALAAGSLPEANVGSAHRPGVRSCRRKKICSDSRKISPWQFSTCGLRPLGVQAAYRSPLHKRPQDTSSASLSPPLSAQRSFPRAGSRQCCKRDTEVTPVTAVKPGKGVCKAEHNAILINAAFVLEKLFP
jgi:hypothetical protein